MCAIAGLNEENCIWSHFPSNHHVNLFLKKLSMGRCSHVESSVSLTQAVIYRENKFKRESRRKNEGGRKTKSVPRPMFQNMFKDGCGYLLRVC